LGKSETTDIDLTSVTVRFTYPTDLINARATPFKSYSLVQRTDRASKRHKIKLGLAPQKERQHDGSHLTASPLLEGSDVRQDQQRYR